MTAPWDADQGFAVLRRLLSGYAAAQAEQRRTGRESDAAEVARQLGSASIAEDLLLDARAAEAKAAWYAARGQVFRFGVELCLIGDEFRKEDGPTETPKP